MFTIRPVYRLFHTKMKAYLQDTKHLLQFLGDLECRKNCILVTADIKLFFTSTDHKEAVEPLKWVLEKFLESPWKHKRYLIKCLDFGLKHNYFRYGNWYYQQITGIGLISPECGKYLHVKVGI